VDLDGIAYFARRKYAIRAARPSPCHQHYKEVIHVPSIVASRPPALINALLATAAAASIAAPVAAAAGPIDGGFHAERFTEQSFCGTGVAVDGLYESHFSTTQRGDMFQTTHQGTLTFTHADSSVILAFAGQFTYQVVEGTLDTLHTNLLVTKGLNGRLMLADGRTLVVDAGVLAQLVLLTPRDETLNEEIAWTHGPHPLITEPDTFCAATTEALGIP
jgi:hypothetical protein